MSGPTETVAFFGATGGCILAALTRAVNAGYNVNALARTPSKLTNLLAEHGVAQDKIDRHLHIVEGNAKDPDAVEKTLIAPGNNDRVVDLVLNGLGGTPNLTKNIMKPVTLDDPRICAETTDVIVKATRKLVSQFNVEPSKKPAILVISTTGVSEERDVPIAFLPMYHWLLAVPHEDKKIMEAQVQEAVSAPESNRPFQGAIIVRPSLLMDGVGKGLNKVRVGWETHDNDVGKPAVGYTITRDDVGAWVFESVVNNMQRSQWFGRKVTLTN